MIGRTTYAGSLEKRIQWCGEVLGGARVYRIESMPPTGTVQTTTVFIPQGVHRTWFGVVFLRRVEAWVVWRCLTGQQPTALSLWRTRSLAESALDRYLAVGSFAADRFDEQLNWIARTQGYSEPVALLPQEHRELLLAIAIKNS